MTLGYTLSAKDVINYYSGEICKEMYRFSRGRKVIIALSDLAFTSHKDRLDVVIRKPEDYVKAISPIVLNDRNPACLMKFLLVIFKMAMTTRRKDLSMQPLVESIILEYTVTMPQKR